MVAARSGRIVNIASTAGLKGYPRVAAYCASKHGLVGLTRALAVEIARHGVTVNAVCPGYTEDTGMLRAAVDNVSARPGGRPTRRSRVLVRQSPRGDARHAGGGCGDGGWLCSPGASAITGQAMAVAAGEVM